MRREILSGRKKDVLKAAVESYIYLSRPVGSRALVQQYHFKLSPATIRNEMSELESLGYFHQPHTSAGRVPTDKGYRFYVDSLLKTEKIDRATLSRLEKEYYPERRTLEQIVKEISKSLSSLTHQTAVVLTPQFARDNLNRVELVATGGKRILMLLVSDFGFIEDRFIQVEEQISRQELQKLNALLNNQNKKSLKEMLLGLDKDSKESFSRLYKKAQRIFKEICKAKNRKKIYLDGTRFFLEAPEFKNREKVDGLLESLEKKETFERMFKNAKADETKVLIGPECGCKDMKECSVVFASYKLGDESIGTVGIIGPKRMNYRQALTLVSSTAKRLTFTFSQTAKEKKGGEAVYYDE